MKSYKICGGYSFRIAIGLLMLGICFTFIASAGDTSVVIRGNPVTELDDPDLLPSWEAQTFAGFFYDIKSNKKTESLLINQMHSELDLSRKIEDKNLIYMTGKAMIEFKVHEKEGLNVINTSVFYSDAYPIVGWKGEKWIAVNGHANKLARLAYEMGSEDKKTLSTGETWALGSGYDITINAIDARSTPRQVWFTLKKDGIVIEEAISSEKNVYSRTQTIIGESDALLFTVYIDRIFSGATSDLVQFKYAWLNDADSAFEIQPSDKFDALKVKEANDYIILLENDGPVNLSRNTEVNVFGGISFRIADSNELRFYPYMRFIEPGQYKIRGQVFSFPQDYDKILKWDGRTFAGFYYDLNTNTQTESLEILENISNLSISRIINKNEMLYKTLKIPVDFKVFEKEGVNVDGSNTFYIEGWQGEKYANIKGAGNKLAKLVLEMKAGESKLLSEGDTWKIGSGYNLTVISIDANSTQKQVLFQLSKNGTLIEEGIARVPIDSSLAEKQKAVYVKKTTILNESNALLFSIYAENISKHSGKDAVTFRYGWLIDGDSAIEIKASDIFDEFRVDEASPNGIILSNRESVSLSKNTEPVLMGKFKFGIADSNNLRFYIGTDHLIPEIEYTPGSRSILINNGDKYSNSRNVTLSVSASNVTEMSFSNDNVSWSLWEPYTTTKSWTLSSDDGLKNVYFKARNNASEVSPVSDSIILDTIPPSMIIFSPENDSNFSEPNVTIIGTVSDVSGITQGCITQLSEHGGGRECGDLNNTTSFNFSHNIRLQEGWNKIIIEYIDAANNSAEASINLTSSIGIPAVSLDMAKVKMLVNSSRIFNLTLNIAPAGLSGYNLTVSLSNGSVAQIIALEFPEWASLHNNSSLPSDRAWMKAVDLDKKIENGSDNVLLAKIAIRGKTPGKTDLLINAEKMDDDKGIMMDPETMITQIEVEPDIALPDTDLPPTDPDNDGLYEDLNGNGIIDFSDVTLFFEYMEWIAENKPISDFDFNNNGRIDFADVILLFDEL